MKSPLLPALLWAMIAILTACSSQQPPTTRNHDPSPYPDDREVGGPCEDCDLMYEGMPPMEKISSEAFIASPRDGGRQLGLQGTIVHLDGKTPAPNILLYFYHTDTSGHYTPGDTQTVGRRHGHLRGWVRSDDEGKFYIHTIRPHTYPSRTDPAHIHLLVKEPGKTRYWIDDVIFEDDPLVTPEYRKRSEYRGGDRIIALRQEAGAWQGKVEIILGKNIPDY
jgi:protocatechuate 3,4-dioxygenase, beta subunit